MTARSDSLLRSEAVRVWVIRAVMIGVFVIVWKVAGATGTFNPIFIGTPEGTLRAFFLQFVNYR